MKIALNESLGAGIRSEFPILEHKTYLNSCSQGALSLHVREAYDEYLAGWDENGAEWNHWVERAETMRSSFARLLHASADEVAITTSVSQAVAGVVSALRFDHRPRIVISDYEFPTVGQIAHAQELRGAEIVHVHPASDGSIPPERFAELVDERTSLVCCTAVSYRTGHRHDIDAVTGIAHEKGALCLVDGYQAVGVLDLDPGSLHVDFMTGGTVKYLLASAGLGFLYIRQGLAAELLPTQTGWFADEDIFKMDITDYSPAPDARRFDSGTPPVPNIYAGVAGASLIEEAGTATIETHVGQLSAQLIDGLELLGATVVTPRTPEARGPLVCVHSTDVDALVAALKDDDVVVSSRDDNIRLALHLYNTPDDIDTALASIAHHRHLLA
jgi:selenocysteine lyase/cysteine desulfurase